MKVKGAGIGTMDNDRLADVRLNTIGFVFQVYHLFRRLAIAENVGLPLILKQADWDAWIAAANRYLDVFGLKDRGMALPRKLVRRAPRFEVRTVRPVQG